ncbi:transcription elongation factor [Jiulongibacter sediminis]|uniref:transcription elongation factor n=1 Tax=Jiulongibacter sediminis TaxID=1605367 RepID=UPI0026EAC2C5|nr:transcription elongation factor [Jiulongibacter sediminis]
MKEELLKLAKAKVQLRLDEARKAMTAAQTAANEETKSSAGDKYETGRAMAQNDRDMYARQEAEAKAEMAVLQSIDPQKKYEFPITGALIETSIGKILIATSIGFLQWNGEKAMVISETSPLAQALKGKKAEETFEFRGQQVKIISIS